MSSEEPARDGGEGAASGCTGGDGGSGGGDDSGRDGSARTDHDVAGGRVRASLLWGLVGALSFLVLVQGYELLGGRAVGVGVKAGVALAVGVAATGTSYALEGWLTARLDGGSG